MTLFFFVITFRPFVMGTDKLLTWNIPALTTQLAAYNLRVLFSEKKFNPNLYRPVILSPRPGIMQNFIANRGKVTAFKKTDTVVQLRKPQVYKVRQRQTDVVTGIGD